MKSILICGAYDHTGNLGVSALGNSFAAAWHYYRPEDDIYLQALDGKIRMVSFQGFNNTEFNVLSVSLRPSRKFYKLDTFFGLKWSKLIGIKNPYQDVFDKIDIFFDVAGGDSFTDLYGDLRFKIINAIKDKVIENKKPLILLPQTYGPYLNDKTKSAAEEYVRYSSMCLARDSYSFDILKELAGQYFDPNMYQCGVDMAFLLPVKESLEKIHPSVKTWLNNNTDFIGINISGLILNQPEESKARYSFKADYKTVVRDFLIWILESTDLKIVIVPHVLVDFDSVESDYRASMSVVDSLPECYLERVVVQDSTLDQCEIKYLISKCSWFMGTRMHATIASLSSEVPTSTISYSDKALGVFQSCGCESSVIDPRKLSTEEVFSALKDSFMSRDSSREVLKDSIPAVKEIAMEQVRKMTFVCQDI